MDFQWISVLLLATSWAVVTADYDPQICSVIKESHGLVPPPIPRDFEARYELIDFISKEISYEEFYFDYSNSREKYVFLSKGIEHHFLYDYDTQQVVTYDRLRPGVDFKKDPMSHVCTTIEMEDLNWNIDLSRETSGSKLRMRSSNEDLAFGGRHPYAFNDSFVMKDRGVPVDEFLGCVYDDETDVTMSASYLFTTKASLLGVGTAAGTIEEEVTGIQNGFLSVPVKSHFEGSMRDEEAGTHRSFNHTSNYFWFKGEPEFKMDTFKIPPYLYCKKYRGRKDMPKFFTAFETRIQKTAMVRDIMGNLATSEIASFENVMYHKDRSLARRDFTPGEQDTEIKNKFNTMSPVKTIYDFNEGLLYTTNVASGRCYIRPISHNDFFEKGSNGYFIEMAEPEHVFQMESDEMEYKGKDFTRDIECDVWSGLQKDKNLNATFIKETYISTNGWHELADELSEYGVPIKHTVIQNELNGEMVEGVLSYNFLKFKTKAPLLRTFDVSNCIETQNTKDFAILLTISEATKQTIFNYKLHFLDVVQNYITGVTTLISPLRVQRLALRNLPKTRNVPVILFTLVDKIKLKTKIPVGQTGATLDEAIVKLQNYVDQNQFVIKFYPPNSEEAIYVPALKGSLYIKKGSGDLTYYAPVEEILASKEDGTQSEKVMYDDDTSNDEDEDGMSSGSLTLLSFAMLFIGIGIGIAAMYLYFRYTSESKMEDRIQLSFKSTEDGKDDIIIAENAQ